MNRPPVALVIAAGLATSFALLNPVHDTDLFWQVKFGELAIAQGGPVRVEPFYPDALGRPIVPIYGLAQVWYAAVRKVGGWELIKLLDAVFWAVAFFLPAWAAQKRFDPYRGWPVAFAMIIGAFAASKFYMTRPQTLAMLGFGAFLAVILSTKSFQWKIVVGSIVLVLWQNAHPSVIMGGFVAGVLCAIGWIRGMIQRIEKPWAETVLTIVAGAAIFATPAGTGILSLMRENSDRVSLFLVTEWLPLFHPLNRGVIFPAIVGMTITLIAMILRWRNLEWGWATVALILAGLTVWSHRFIVFFAVVAVIVWIQAMAKKKRDESLFIPVNNIHGLMGLAFLVLAFGLLLAGRLPLWNSWFPHAGVDSLKRESLKGPIFTNTVWGGLITFHGDPDWHVTHDGRYFARTHDECRWYLSALHGEVTVEEMEAKMKPVAFFLMPEETKLSERLLASARWRVSHQDNDCIVLIRN